jgi:hypothetical protein
MGYSGTIYGYLTTAIDPDGHQLKYTFDWGDGSTSETGFVNSGTSLSASHSWNIPTGTYNVKAKATDINGNTSQWSDPKVVTIRSPNPPNTPSIPSGPITGYTRTSYYYSTSGIDPDGPQVKYTFDWGDGSATETGFVNSGASASLSHAWSIPGTYNIKAKTIDIYGASSEWSGSKNITIVSISPLNAPSMPSGPISGYTGPFYNYSTSATDPDGDQVKYTFDWGDNSTSETEFVNSSANASASHSWNTPPGTYYIRAKATDIYGVVSQWSGSKNVTIFTNPPNTPSIPIGPSTGYTGTACNYSTSATDPDRDQMNYTIDWGDGSTSETGLINSGTNASLSHIWRIPGTYNIRAKATDIYEATSQWSGYNNITIATHPPNTPSIPLGPSTGYTSPKN